MSRKIGLYIGGRRFDVDVENDFAQFLELEMEKDFNVEGNNELKSVMEAYVRKNYELYQQKKEIDTLLAEFEK